MNESSSTDMRFLQSDPAQLPPVADRPLYHSKPTRSIAEQGHLAYLMFTNVIKLSVNQRVQGSNPEQSQFRELLMRLRTGDCTEQDWKLLLTRQPTMHQTWLNFKMPQGCILAMKKLQIIT